MPETQARAPRLLTPLDVASRLATVMTLHTPARVVAATGVCRERLLDMIALQAPFSRPVLRYLRISKRYVEWDATDDGD